MKVRPAVTLMEVLVTMFIMAIGMLAVLVLFPLGAVSMGQALKDDRCTSAASMAEQYAIVKNVRHDPALALPTPPYPQGSSLFTTQTLTSPPTTIPATWNGPSFPVYVDPYAVLAGLTTLGTPFPPYTMAPIQRTGVTYAGSSQLVDYWFSLPNDITFLSTGTPDLSAGQVERGREYNWAYLLRRPMAWSHEAVDLTVVVYRKRPVSVPNVEQTYPATGAQNTSGVVLTWNPAAQSPNLKRGVWLLDTTPITGTNPPVPRADFYRVVNISDSGAGSAVLDVQPNIIADPTMPGSAMTQAILMDDVAEVFHKGTSWQP
jgi:hypothetical protein